MTTIDDLAYATSSTTDDLSEVFASEDTKIRDALVNAQYVLSRVSREPLKTKMRAMVVDAIREAGEVLGG